MHTVSLFVELIRTRPRLVFWLAVLAQSLLWTVIPWLFYTAPPGEVADVIAVGHSFPFGTDLGPPLAYWMAEVAFRIGGLLGVYALSQLCVVVTFCAVFSLGSLIAGPHHAVLAILLMAGVTAFGTPTPDFGPAILSMPLWALALLHFYRAVGLGQNGYWYALAVDLGLLLLTSYQGLILVGLLAAFLLMSGRSAVMTRSLHPWIAAVLVVLILFPHLILIDQANPFALAGLPHPLTAEAFRASLMHGLRLVTTIAVSHAGLAILVLIAVNATRVRRAEAIAIHRPATDAFARLFVYFFAIAPAVAVTLVAMVTKQSEPVVLNPALVLSALAVVVAAGDSIALHHQRLLAWAWAGLLLLPPLFATVSVLATPWTGFDLRITQPAVPMAQFLAENYQRRTGQPLAVVAGNTRLASLVAMFAPSRPVIFVDDNPSRPVNRKTIAEKGAVVVWQATDAAGTPPPEIKALFPDLVPEVPRAFERVIEGRLQPFRIGWATIRPQAQNVPAPPAAAQ